MGEPYKAKKASTIIIKPRIKKPNAESKLASKCESDVVQRHKVTIIPIIFEDSSTCRFTKIENGSDRMRLVPIQSL